MEKSGRINTSPAVGRSLAHVFLVQWLLLMFALALLSSGVLLPLHSDPEELRMG